MRFSSTMLMEARNDTTFCKIIWFIFINNLYSRNISYGNHQILRQNLCIFTTSLFIMIYKWLIPRYQTEVSSLGCICENLMPPYECFINTSNFTCPNQSHLLQPRLQPPNLLLVLSFLVQWMVPTDFHCIRHKPKTHPWWLLPCFLNSITPMFCQFCFCNISWTHPILFIPSRTALVQLSSFSTWAN